MGVRRDEEGFPSWPRQNGDGKGRTPPRHVIVSAKGCIVSNYYNRIILKTAPIVGNGHNGPSPALVVLCCVVPSWPCCGGRLVRVRDVVPIPMSVGSTGFKGQGFMQMWVWVRVKLPVGYL